MGCLERIYDKSPIYFQNIMCTVSGYQRNAHCYGKIYWNERKFLQEFDNWTLDEKLKYQENALLEVDRTKWYGEQEQFLLDEFLHKFGSDMNVKIQIVNEIPRESSGKFRMIVNTVDC